MPRGGKRPGAGAPKGNLNALKAGLYSRRVRRGLLMIALLPEVQDVLRALKHQPAAERYDKYRQAVLAAYQATLSDPDLAESIRSLIRQRLIAASFPFFAPQQKLSGQSDNQKPHRTTTAGL